MLITIHSDSDNDSDAHYDTQKLNTTVNICGLITWFLYSKQFEKDHHFTENMRDWLLMMPDL